MRFVITGEWDRNRLLQTIIALYALYVVGLWVTNALLYFNKMSLTYDSVVSYYLGDESRYMTERSYQGMLEVSHFHFFAMGLLLLVLTHLVLFVPIRSSWKAWLVAVPFLSAFLSEGSSWGVRFVDPAFAYAKIAGFLLMQTSLAVLVGISFWAVFSGSQRNYQDAGRVGERARGS